MNNAVISFFAGAGGLDTGFEQAGFNIPWANEFDKKITPTLQANHPDTHVDDRNLFDIPSSDIPDNPVGIVGGPPCQSWSLGGLGKGLEDKRGQVFLEYIRVIRDKQPKFFLAENVKGILAKSRKKDLDVIIQAFADLNYHFDYKLVNARDYGVPEDRWRVIFVGYHESIGKPFTFPEPASKLLSLQDSIWDLRETAVKAQPNGNPNPEATNNHEYLTGGFSSQYMSRNRVRAWNEPSFTIQASGRQAPIHPDSPKMVRVSQDEYRFADENYRRLTIREAARIQTFPDEYKFLYNKAEYGYKMIGNAVPVEFARQIASAIYTDMIKQP